MIKRTLALLTVLSLLLGCAAAGAFAETDYATGIPWLNSDLDGVVTEDTPASPKDDFALYVNKDDILSLTIPTGYPYGGTIIDGYLLFNEDMKNMFLGEAPASHDAKLAYDLFWLMMDWDSRNAVGVAPLKRIADSIEAIPSLDALSAYLTDTPVEDQSFCFWKCGPGMDMNDSSRSILCIRPMGLLLEDSAEYGALTELGAIKKEAKTALARKILIKMGYPEEETACKIENCLAFETLVASAIFSSATEMSPDYAALCNNHLTRAELLTRQNKLPILAMAEKTLGYPQADDYMITDPAYLDRLNEVWTEENLPLLRDCMIVRSAVSYAASLDRECYDWIIECSHAISGASGNMEDEIYCAEMVSSMLVWPVARLYTEKYLRQEDKERITAVIREIVEAYHGILEEAEWLSAETRAKAIEKLDAIEFRVLFPDSWEKYSCEELNFASAQEGGTFFEAYRQIMRYSAIKNVEVYTQPLDKEKWDAYGKPNTFNCVYSPQENAAYICGAFARGSIYNSGMSDEELYARIGMVIGHEISHAFDSSGAQYDKDGNLANWWTEADWAAFRERNEKMVAYYNAMQPWEGQRLQGGIMTGEACADMAALKCMLRIAAGKPDFDYDAFFRSYAGLWLKKSSLQIMYAFLNDSHPLGYLRVNATLQQFDEFLNFYGITEGDGMYLAPEDRVSIW